MDLHVAPSLLQLWLEGRGGQECSPEITSPEAVVRSQDHSGFQADKSSVHRTQGLAEVGITRSSEDMGDSGVLAHVTG